MRHSLLVRMTHKVYRLVANIFQKIIEYRHFAFYRYQVSEQSSDANVIIQEFREYGEEVTRIHQQMNREHYYPPEKLQQRFTRGLHFYVMWQGAHPVATTWFHPQGRRFIDELGYIVESPGGSIWLRDIFVSPECRGQNLFSVLVNQAIAQYYPSTRSVYSDLEAANSSSVKAHLKCGFRPIGSIKAVHLLKTLILRGAANGMALEVEGFKPTHRFCITANQYQNFRTENLA